MNLYETRNAKMLYRQLQRNPVPNCLWCLVPTSTSCVVQRGVNWKHEASMNQVYIEIEIEIEHDRWLVSWKQSYYNV